MFFRGDTVTLGKKHIPHNYSCYWLRVYQRESQFGISGSHRRESCLFRWPVLSYTTVGPVRSFTQRVIVVRPNMWPQSRPDNNLSDARWSLINLPRPQAGYITKRPPRHLRSIWDARFRSLVLRGNGQKGKVSMGCRQLGSDAHVWPHLVSRYGLWNMVITQLSFSSKEFLGFMFPLSQHKKMMSQGSAEVRKQAIKGWKIPKQLGIKTKAH